MRYKLVDLLNFGNTLKELRTQNGMTQQQLATQIGVSKSVVSYYELQERTPSPEILLKLASIFHVSSDYLLGIEKNNVLDVSGLEAEDIAVLNSMITLLRKKESDYQIKKQGVTYALLFHIPFSYCKFSLFKLSNTIFIDLLSKSMYCGDYRK